MVMQWQDGIPDDAHKRTWGLDLSGTRHGAGGVGGLLGVDYQFRTGHQLSLPVLIQNSC